MSRPAVMRLDDYGLTLKELLALKDRLIKIRAHICYADRKPLFQYPPDVRKRKLRDIENELFNKLMEIWPSKDFEIIGTKSKPSGLSGKIKAEDLKKVLNKKIVEHIWIEEIDGLNKQKLPKEELWFAVKANFVIQIEGQCRGYQDIEERIVIVRAYDCNDAKKRLLKNFKDYDEPYLNKYGEMVRWHFDEVVDVYEMNEDTIDPKGTEVYSQFKRRRLIPEYEWHPLKESKN